MEDYRITLKKVRRRAIIFTVLVFIILIFSLIFIEWGLRISKSPLYPSQRAKLTWDKCCHGNPCTDTYYDIDGDVCIIRGDGVFVKDYIYNSTR